MSVVDLSKAYVSVSEDIDAVDAWCSSVYDEKFKSYFENTKALHRRLEDKEVPITDDELSYILIDIPLTLIDVSEVISSMRVSHETIKLRNKSDKIEDPDDLISRKLLASAYEYIIGRVEREISFSRELVMSAKKIWDSRRRTESADPVNPSESLPDKSNISLGNYIK